ncbi:MAG: hypothetical protein IT384_22025 [Deltaproteobacteria bacterium]|nr:hypothetical protein [Deltaproteobacteria bacterium]
MRRASLRVIGPRVVLGAWLGGWLGASRGERLGARLRAWLGAWLAAWLGASRAAWLGARLRAWLGASRAERLGARLRAWLAAWLGAWLGASRAAWLGASLAACASPIAPPRAPLPAGELPPGLGGEARLHALRAGVRAACGGGDGGVRVVAEIQVGPTGAVRSVVVDATVAEAERACLERALRSQSFPLGEEFVRARVTLEL